VRLSSPTEVDRDGVRHLLVHGGERDIGCNGQLLRGIEQRAPLAEVEEQPLQSDRPDRAADRAVGRASPAHASSARNSRGGLTLAPGRPLESAHDGGRKPREIRAARNSDRKRGVSCRIPSDLGQGILGLRDIDELRKRVRMSRIDARGGRELRQPLVGRENVLPNPLPLFTTLRRTDFTFPRRLRRPGPVRARRREVHSGACAPEQHASGARREECACEDVSRV
jgi:hypothetical protein